MMRWAWLVDRLFWNANWVVERWWGVLATNAVRRVAKTVANIL